MNRATSLSHGAVHTIPPDIKKVVSGTQSILELWKSLTPLARNEWICWVVSAKKSQTRTRRISVMRTQLLAGKRRPCCWAGCPHRI